MLEDNLGRAMRKSVDWSFDRTSDDPGHPVYRGGAVLLPFYKDYRASKRASQA